MNARWLTASAVLLVCVLGVFAAVGSAGTTLQPAPGPAGEAGRYRMISHGTTGFVYMNDTTTGECWQLNPTAKKWVKVAPPVAIDK